MSMTELVRGSTVQEWELPTGCSRIVEHRDSTFPGTCRKPMRHVAIKFDYEDGVLEAWGFCDLHVRSVHEYPDESASWTVIRVAGGETGR